MNYNVYLFGRLYAIFDTKQQAESSLPLIRCLFRESGIRPELEIREE